MAASPSLNRILYTTDSHYGWERVDGVTRPIHDRKAHEIVLAVASDFKPTHVVIGGDGVDAGAISHHNKGKPRVTEGLRLGKDAKAYRDEFLTPLERSHPKAFKRYHLGNHERFLDDALDELPGLEGVVSIKGLLGLADNGWDVIPLGEVSKIAGRLYFMHGDQVRGGQYYAKWAVESYGRSVIFGHFHSSQRYTKHNAIDATDVHRGFAIGCLCRRDPGYGRKAPNKWSQSFALVEEDCATGQFQVTEVDIFRGKAVWNGKVYRG